MGIAALLGTIFFVLAFVIVFVPIGLFVNHIVHKKEQKELSQTAPANAVKGPAMINGNVTNMTCPYCRKANKIRVHDSTSYWDFMDKNKIFRFKGNYFYAKCNSCKNQISMEKVFNYLESTYFQVIVDVVWWEDTQRINAAEEWEPATAYPRYQVAKKVVKGLRKAFEVSGSNYKVFNHNSLVEKAGLSHVETLICAYGSRWTKDFLKFEDKDLSRIVLK